MDQMPSDRRQFPRTVTVKPCKVRSTNSTRYISGQTSDYSNGGALLCVSSEHALKAGDTIELGIAWANEAVLQDRLMRTATVRRVISMNEFEQALGIEFAEVEKVAERKAA
ncbi:MAG: PilZ domain-containing protein [Planctomycetota bacterium]